MCDCTTPPGGTNADYRTGTKRRTIAMLPPVVRIQEGGPCCSLPPSGFPLSSGKRIVPTQHDWMTTLVTDCPVSTVNTNVGGSVCGAGDGLPSQTVIVRTLPRTTKIDEYERPMRASASSLLTRRIQTNAVTQTPYRATNPSRPVMPVCAPMRPSRAGIPRAPNPCYSAGQRSVDFSSPFK